MTPLGSPHRVIVVSASPDGSIRDTELATFARTMHLRVDTRVDAVALLNGPTADHWRQCCSHLVILDDARTWPIAAASERLGNDAVTDRVRGARLTWLLSELGTYDIALLDQGLGADVLDRLGASSALVVARWRADGPTDCAGRLPAARADLVLDEQRVGAPIAGPSQPWAVGFDPEPGWLAALDYRRAETRARLGIDAHQPLVVGIGASGSRSQFDDLRPYLDGLGAAWAPDDANPVEVIAASDVVIGLGEAYLDRTHVAAAWASGAITVCDLSDGTDQATGALVAPDHNPAIYLARGIPTNDGSHAVADRLNELARSAHDQDRRGRAAARIPDRDWIADQLIAAAVAAGRTNPAPAPLYRSFRERAGTFARRARSR